jgi:hypothetical protein
MYVGVIPTGWLELRRLPKGRLLIRLSDEGKRMRGTLATVCA